MAANHTGKYLALWRWLRDSAESRINASFGQIEEILGFTLPPSSRNHLSHWYGYKASAVARAIRDAGWKTSSVNLTDETVQFARLAAISVSSRERIADLFDERGVDPAISGVLLEVAQQTTVEVCSEESKQIALSAAPDAYAAVYVGQCDLAIAVDTNDARRIHERHGLRLQAKSGPTSYLHVGPTDLTSQGGRQIAMGLVKDALDRAFHGPRWERGLPDRTLQRGAICPICNMEKSLTGVCLSCV